ncbi:hypothetical protein PWT90_08818 [Aphanocladium album]|nr:hypothetical protein PWT90_08818 [Aphanocladium album]
MNTASPKRRAALATLDANAITTTSTPTSIKQSTTVDADPCSSLPRKQALSVSHSSRRSSGLMASAPVLAPPAPAAAASPGMPSVGMKRSSGMVLQDPVTKTNTTPEEEEEESPAAKKSKLDQEEEAAATTTTTTTTTTTAAAAAPPTSSAATTTTRSRTHSPDASSVFDASGAEDATWVTEPDVLVQMAPVVAAVPRPPVLTREQAREGRENEENANKDVQQKVEILRLRLGLASYKLRTGQISIPLADLQARPLPAPGVAAPMVESTPESSQGNDDEQDDEEEREEEDVVAATPPAAATISASS